MQHICYYSYKKNNLNPKELFMSNVKLKDYSLVGEDSKKAVNEGLAEAEWYQCPVPREQMRELLKRRDWPAIRDTLVWFSLLIASGAAALYLWGSWWCIIPFLIYGVIYASSSDSRWHESSHGTAFKTDWMNNALYEISSFMVMRESTLWRWSHTRHHSDTIIVGRDPEIAVPRPPDIKALILSFFNLGVYPTYFSKILLHSTGKLFEDEKEFVPESEHKKIFIRAKIYLAIYLFVIGLSIYLGSILPLLFVGLTNLYGSWVMPIYGYTQHAGLAENVLDHRLNCRTVYMNFVNRYLYWNMNYHVEHHMFPLVPYHNLPKLHELIKEDCPKPYSSILDAWKEIIPAVLRQVKDPGYYVKRKLPEGKKQTEDKVVSFNSENLSMENGWVDVCHSDELRQDDILRFDYNNRTYAIYRTIENELYASDGMCTHGKKHLSEGLIIGNQIECPKHNGRFDLRDGSPKRAPVCIKLKTYDVRIQDDRVLLKVKSTEKTPTTTSEVCEDVKAITLKKYEVKSNENVSTFIKELVLSPVKEDQKISYQPGDYIQIKIPEYGEIKFSEFDIKEPYRKVWEDHHVFDYKSSNEAEASRNYSLATNPSVDQDLKFNVRIATPPRGQDCDAGIGSTYVFNLKEGDIVEIMDPEGDFHIKDSEKEMIYIGGGAGMAPLRSHISYLFETSATQRKVSFWYGARSKQEIFYEDYFKSLADKYNNFNFHLGLSEPLAEDQWTGSKGFIHDIVFNEYLKSHQDPLAVEYYLCGPPMMIQACKEMLTKIGVSDDQIAYDEF